MNKETFIRLNPTPAALRTWLTGILLVFCAAELDSESLTLTTYYPAPSGVYARMITTDSTFLARNGGNVGIGTTNPGQKLDVAGNVNVAGSVNAAASVNVGRSVRFAPLSSDPPTAGADKGELIYNGSEDRFKYYNGSQWQPLAGGGGPGAWNCTLYEGATIANIASLAICETGTFITGSCRLNNITYQEMLGGSVNTPPKGTVPVYGHIMKTKLGKMGYVCSTPAKHTPQQLGLSFETDLGFVAQAWCCE